MNRDTIYKIFGRIPTLETERLILRKMRTSDTRDMYEYSRLPKVTKYLLWDPHESSSQTLEYLEYLQTRYRLGDFYDWGVVFRESGKMIGTCGFTRFDFENNSAEVGYVLNPDFWGRGIAAEALKRVMHFGFMELNLHRIEARYMSENSKSRRVMEKCKMKFEGIKRSSLYVKGQYHDVGSCSILSEEFIKEFL